LQQHGKQDDQGGQLLEHDASRSEDAVTVAAW
jgi:hypothetical protein